MSSRQFEGTEAECLSLIATMNLLEGYPRRGRNVGGGRHALDSSAKAGWSTAYAAAQEHPTIPGLFAVPLGPEAERHAGVQEVDDAIAAAKSRDASWHRNPQTP